ncbi:MAG TPA: CPBP family intramembrane metalloprotease [Thermoplasmata archaeon]|nr:CPBP family intramembrane metalloprotease [Thermoplasmata archaeon]
MEGATGRHSSVRRVFGDILRLGLAFWAVLFVVLLILSHLVALAIAVAVVPGELIHRSVSLYLVTPWPVSIVTIGGAVLVAYFIAVVAAILLATARTAVRSRTFPSELRRLVAFRHPGASSDVMLLIHILLIHLALAMLYIICLHAVGISMRTPDFESMPDWELLFILANASVYEEGITRVLMIGLPLLVVDILRRRWHPVRRYIVGGGLPLDTPALVLLAASSTVFALAHVVEGWDVWKFPPTLLAGLMFGVLFLRRGLHASIMFHFMIDYLAVSPMLNLPTAYIVSMALVQALLVLSALPLGLYLTHRYALMCLRAIRLRRRNDRGITDV